MELHRRPGEKAQNKFRQKEFILHKEIAAEEGITEAPQDSRNQKQGEKLMLPLPWAVGKKNNKQRDISDDNC